MSDRAPREDGPTEVVETDSGELLGAWAYVWIVSGQRLGLGALFGGFGIYTAVAGSAGPCVLWLAGRAQGHTLGWFLATSAKIALVMVGIVLAFLLLILLVMGGRIPVAGGLAAAGVMVVVALVLSVIWGVATWAADRWIARARVEA